MRSIVGRTMLRVAAVLALATLAMAVAQGIPYVPPELHQDVRRLQGDRITFCIWSATSPTADLDRAVARVIGEVLLVEVVYFEFRPSGDLSPDEFLEDVYIQLGANCDAIAGFVLAPDNYPEWLVPTRPYLAAPYVALVPESSELTRLGDVPAGGIVGSHVYTEGDYQLINYLAALPADSRWRRFGYASIEHMAGHIVRGTLAAGLAWQPSWVAAASAGATGVRAVPTGPVPTAVSNVGFVVRSDNVFLRTAIDQALAVMEDDGLLAEIAAAFGLDHAPR